MKIRKILYLGAALLMVGCSSEDGLGDDTLSGNCKTPLLIEASLSTEHATTRAAGNAFAKDDVLLAYLRHTTGAKTGNPLAYPVTNADQAPKLVSFTLNKNISETANYSVSGTTDLTTAMPLYWDDFSEGGKGDATDLRTTGHGLQSYYGYCYNGGTPTTALTPTTGVLGWTIGNQTTAEAVQHADLLWSAEQDAVTYEHASSQGIGGAGHGILTIPYTHAMSEITVTVTADEGFVGSTNPLASTVLTLNAMSTVTTFTAPSQAFTSGTPDAVQMYAEPYTSESLTRNYTAIVAPGTKLKEGVKLLDITNVEDNDYTLTITSSMLTATAWAEGHKSADPVQYGSEGTPAKAFVITQPGINYHLNVTVKKTAIQTHASLADWRTVNASGTGDIKFPDDQTDTDLIMDDAGITQSENVKVVAVDKNKFVNGASFTLFTLKNDAAHDEAGERDNDSYSFATVSTFKDNDDDANDEWVNDPQIYWPNQTDRYYFRALAQFNGKTGDVNNITNKGTDKATAIAVSQGYTAANDILWGTTAKHWGTSTTAPYDRGQAIPPRTGGVPIAFEHAMSKVTFQLETASATDPNAQVDLTNATIAVTNLYTSGTITIENGVITYTDDDMNSEIETLSSAAIPTHTAPISELITIPQTITNNAKVIITLADGTTYKLQLNKCVNSDSEENPKPFIGAWERGKHYTYTIHLEKEQITFRALIKDWEGVTGSGNANLEWD